MPHYLLFHTYVVCVNVTSLTVTCHAVVSKVRMACLVPHSEWNGNLKHGNPSRHTYVCTYVLTAGVHTWSLPQLFPSSHALIAAQITFNQVASARCVRVEIAFIVAPQE